jgi:DNA-directed RNA polymerase subunit RPC12/RpoP
MGRKTENTSFICLNCKAQVTAITKGTIRNHCPFCLYSLHLDVKPGDRACGCRGLMAPYALDYHSQKGWQIIHLCQKCSHKTKNITSSDDDIDKIAEIMKKTAF